MPSSTTTIGSGGYNMGKGGYAGYNRIQLPSMGPTAAPSSPEINFRKDILYYFSNLTIDGGIFGIKNLYDGVSGASEVKKSIDEAKRQNWGQSAGEMETLKSAVEKALFKVKDNAPGWLYDAANEAISAIQKFLPDILKGLIAKLGELGLPVVSNIRAFAKNFAEGVKKVLLIWNTRGVYETLRTGSPTEIVKVLHKELKEDAAIAFAKSVYEIAKGVAATLTAGASAVVTGVVDAIQGFLSYIWSLYKKARDYFALKKFFSESKEHFTANSNIIFKQEQFFEWISQWLDELPIIASHCICSSVTGSYLGFMTAIANDGSEIADSQLKRGYGQFQKLKKPAKDYIKKYPYEFSSSDGVVKMSLIITQKGGYDTTDGAAAKSVGWFRRGLMKMGLMKKTLY